jgi:hypothetical protein
VSASAGARSEGLGDALCENQLSEAVCMSSAFITSMESLTHRHSPLQCKLGEEICVDRAIVRCLSIRDTGMLHTLISTTWKLQIAIVSTLRCHLERFCQRRSSSLPHGARVLYSVTLSSRELSPGTAISIQGTSGAYV